MKNKNLTTFDERIERAYGKRGTPEREEFEKGFVFFKLGVEIKAARQQKGLTQKALAERLGINKAHISRAENDILDVSVSMLRKIVEVGLGGELELAIKL